jgi:hypothetical protein
MNRIQSVHKDAAAAHPLMSPSLYQYGFETNKLHIIRTTDPLKFLFYSYFWW